MGTDRLSALDAVFLPMETDRQSLHVGSVLVLEGPAPDPTAFREHVAQRLAGVPAHHRRVQRMPLDLGRPVWVDARVDLAAHVRRVVLGTPGDEAQLRVLVAQVMAPRLDADRPLWELWQVDGLTGGRWAVIAKVHHTLVDGRAGTDVLRCLLTDEPHEPAPAAVVDPRPAPSRVDLGRDLVSWLVHLPVRAVRLVVRALRAPRVARRRVRRLRFGLAQVLRPDLPPSILTGPLGPRRIWGSTSAELAGVARAARDAGGTVNDVFLAALAGGYRRYLRERGEPLDAMVLRAIVPASPRAPRRTGPAERTGNLASAIFVELPVHLPDAAARLTAVVARTAAQKSGGVADATAAVVRMADHVPAWLLLRAARAYGRSGQGRVNVVASNVPGPPTVQHLADRRVLRMEPYVPVGQEIRACAAMVSYAGRVTIGITADADALPDADQLVAAVGRELDDLVRAHSSTE